MPAFFITYIGPFKNDCEHVAVVLGQESEEAALAAYFAAKGNNPYDPPRNYKAEEVMEPAVLVLQED